jgi:dihydropteroate synthase
MDEGCTQPLSSDPMIHLNTTVFFLIEDVPFVRNLHKLEPLTLTILITMKTTRVREGIETHAKSRIAATTHTHKSGNEHTNTAQRVHNSTSTQILITMIRMRACRV